jgi:ribonuclease HII
MKTPKDGSKWSGAAGERFHVLHTIKIEDKTWVHYIKENAIAWAVSYEDEKVIDEINILQATQSSMHKGISQVLKKAELEKHSSIKLLIDGNYFKPYTYYNSDKKKLEQLDYRAYLPKSFAY